MLKEALTFVPIVFWFFAGVPVNSQQYSQFGYQFAISKSSGNCDFNEYLPTLLNLQENFANLFQEAYKNAILKVDDTNRSSLYEAMRAELVQNDKYVRYFLEFIMTILERCDIKNSNEIQTSSNLLLDNVYINSLTGYPGNKFSIKVLNPIKDSLRIGNVCKNPDSKLLNSINQLSIFAKDMSEKLEAKILNKMAESDSKVYQLTELVKENCYDNEQVTMFSKQLIFFTNQCSQDAKTHFTEDVVKNAICKTVTTVLEYRLYEKRHR